MKVKKNLQERTAKDKDNNVEFKDFSIVSF